MAVTKTNIEWTDSTWSPIRGCSRVSEGCRHCYAETVANRFKGPGQPYEGLIAHGGQWNGKVREVIQLLDQPLHWKKPRRIFVNSMSDLFHENVSDDFIQMIFAVMATAKQHTFQVLTKRPERMQNLLAGKDLRWVIDGYLKLLKAFPKLSDKAFEMKWPLPNVQLGVSVENQATADERIPRLLKTPAAVRWVSAEPLIGSIDLSWAQCTCPSKGDASITRHLLQCPADRRPHRLWSIDWVVVGSESGRGAREASNGWFRSIRDQCKAAGVPFFMKQICDSRGRKLPFDQVPIDLQIREYPL